MPWSLFHALDYVGAMPEQDLPLNFRVRDHAIGCAISAQIFLLADRRKVRMPYVNDARLGSKSSVRGINLSLSVPRSVAAAPGITR